MKTYLKILIGTMFLIPSSVFATSSVPWSITNLTDTFIFPNNVNGVSKNVYIPQSLGIGTSSPETTLTVQSMATGDATSAFTIDGSGLSNGNGDMELEAGLSSTAEANVDFSRAGTVEWQLGIQNGGGSTGNDFELWDGLNNPVFTVNHSSLDVNIGTTTCGGESELCVWGDGGASSNIFQAITSASSSALSISNAGLTTAINFMATASSTIGDGTQAGGLTINGGATTTGMATIVNPTSTALPGLNIATLTNASNDSQFMTINGVARSYFGYLGTTNDAIIQGGGAKGIQLVTNTNNFGQQTFVAVTISGNGTNISNVGIGTTSPYARLSIMANSTAQSLPTALFAIGSSSATFATTTLFSISRTGEMIRGGGAPTISLCGSTPNGSLLTGNDQVGTVTVGGGVVTSCTVTYSTPKLGSPHVAITVDGVTAIANSVSSNTSTGFTVNFAATLGGGTFDYMEESN